MCEGSAMAAEKETLSQSLLQKKFLNRNQKEEDDKKVLDEETPNNEHWYLDVPEEEESHIIETQSFSACQDLLFGRMSFQGFNPEVEKLMVEMNSKDPMDEAALDEELARIHQLIEQRGYSPKDEDMMVWTDSSTTQKSNMDVALSDEGMEDRPESSGGAKKRCYEEDDDFIIESCKHKP